MNKLENNNSLALLIKLKITRFNLIIYQKKNKENIWDKLFSIKFPKLNQPSKLQKLQVC